jgi:YesN/AraC family two-component response regulator
MVCSNPIGYLDQKALKKILVIEDQVETRNFWLKSLKAEGFDTIGAENDQIAMERVKKELPDLIISETITAKLNGYSILSKLRQNPITAIIPFIFVTVKKGWNDIRKGMELGADDYLIKPCTIEELLRAIATRLEKQITQKQWYAKQSQPIQQSLSTHNAKPTDPRLSQVFDFIEANYHQPITLDDVAQAVGYSAAYLTDLVRRQTGQPLHRWIIQRRMTEACSLLLKTNQSIDSIAQAVGYLNTGHFFRQFRQYYGTTPKAWRSAQQT